MDWQNYFIPIILNRGYNYYEDDHVEEIEQIDNGYKAKVIGTEDYYVHIYYDGSNITDMECSCPFAEDGNRCKHMAAVLFKIDAENISKNKTEVEDSRLYIPESSADRIRKLVMTLDPEIIKNELLSLLLSNERLSTGFLAKHSEFDDDISKFITHMKYTARNILYQCSDRSGFVDWRNASTFASRLYSEVLDTLGDFVSDKEETKAAFDVSIYVYKLFADTAIDDSGGESEIFADDCINLWEEILENPEVDDELSMYIFEKLNTECNNIGIGEYFSERIEEFVSDHFTSEGFAASKLDIIDNKIERLINEKSWSSNYELSKYIKERLTIMEHLNYNKDDILAFRKHFWHLPVIREIEINELINAGNQSDLIKLLEVSKEIDKGHPGLVGNYSKLLIKYYNKDGWHQKAKEELFKYITEIHPGDLEAFKELRNCTSKELWLEKREEIFQLLSNKRFDIKPLLAEENLRERLIEALKTEVYRDKGFEKYKIAAISKYEKTLSPEYDEQLLDMYGVLVNNLAEHAGGRSYYQELMGFVKKMLRFPGGKERVQSLLENWRVFYSRRPAMQEEMRAFKIS